MKRVTGGVTTIFVYNIAGQLIAEYDDVASPPQGSGGTSYLTSDHLGSTRVVTGQDQSVKGRYDYLPFGEALGAGLSGRTQQMGYDAAIGLRQKFTQKERDAESGLDYFLARYYSAAQGRFSNPDPGPYTPADAQNWNRYLYVQNNPLKFVDPNGEVLILTGADADYLVGELEKLTGYRLTRDSNTGIVTIDTETARNKRGTSASLAAKLGEVIDSKVLVAISVEPEQANSGKTGILFDSIALRQIDTSDYKAIAKQAPELAAASLGHVIEEYFQVQQLSFRPKDDGRPLGEQIREQALQMFERSHEAGLVFEAKVLSDFTGKPEAKRVQQMVNANTPRFLYTSVFYDVTVKAGAGGVVDIDRVTINKMGGK